MYKLEEIINTVINDDCLKVMRDLPDKCIDLCLCDPPYGINIGSSVGGGKPFGDGASRGQKSIAPKSYEGFDDSRIPTQEYFKEMFRISKNQIIFGGNYFVEYLKNSPCWLVWDKDNSGNFADCELAWTSFDTAVRKFQFRWNGMLQDDMRNKEERFHPTQKPIALFKKILEKYSEPNQLILDPFLGSGTTAVAAKTLDRNFIGIELSPKYVEIAEKRLKTIQKGLF